MTNRIAWTMAAALALAACGGDEGVPQDNGMAVPVESANAVGADNAQAAVLNLSDRERNVVFIRAILDAGLKCDSVTASTRVEDQDGQPTWRADCGTASSHLISITPDGTANILSRT